MKNGMLMLMAGLWIAAPWSASSDEINPVGHRLPYPEVGVDTWVMIEVWLEISAITMSAYFMDFSYKKNMNLCNAVMRALDRNEEEIGDESRKQLTSYRLCMHIDEAITWRFIQEPQPVLAD